MTIFLGILIGLCFAIILSGISLLNDESRMKANILEGRQRGLDIDIKGYRNMMKVIIFVTTVVLCAAIYFI